MDSADIVLDPTDGPTGLIAAVRKLMPARQR